MPPSEDALPTVRTHPWHDVRHHTGGGFRNVWGDDDEPPFLKAAGWVASFLLSSKEQTPAPLRRPDGLAPADGPRLTWLGHASVLLELGGLTVLTDPVFAERASPVPFAGPKREVPLPIAPDTLPPIDLVLLSHDHYDHLDLASIAFLHERDRPLVLAPLGVGARLGGARVVEMDWWQHVEVGGFRVHSAPAKHFSGRTLWDRDRTLWASWYLEPMGGSAPSVYYAGDTAYAPHFADVRARLGAPDVVLMPVGAYEPRWFMARVHVDPEQAVQGFLDLGARESGAHFVAVHWGTFDLADDPLDAPRRLVPEIAAGCGLDPARVHVLPVGGQVTFGG
jgi:N-acyl-phosphatidylethanolamine-hydrolysing phospholipase D